MRDDDNEDSSEVLDEKVDEGRAQRATRSVRAAQAAPHSVLESAARDRRLLAENPRLMADVAQIADRGWSHALGKTRAAEIASILAASSALADAATAQAPALLSSLTTLNAGALSAAQIAAQSPWASAIGSLPVRASLAAADQLFAAMTRATFPDLKYSAWIAKSLDPQAVSMTARALRTALTGPSITQMADAAARLAASAHQIWPENLLSLPVRARAVEAAAESGIPLWRVPGPEASSAFLNAETHQERRAVLTDFGPQIIADCRAELGLISGDLVRDNVQPLLEAAALLEEGRPMGAYSLIAAVMQASFERLEPDGRRRKRLTNHTEQVDHFSVFGLRAAMVLRPLFYAMRPQNTSSKRAAHDGFSRHQAAHVWSTQEATYANGVQGLLVVTALLAYERIHGEIPAEREIDDAP